MSLNYGRSSLDPSRVRRKEMLAKCEERGSEATHLARPFPPLETKAEAARGPRTLVRPVGRIPATTPLHAADASRVIAGLLGRKP